MRLAGTGYYLPEKRLTNADLERIVDTNNDWIVTRTGISERRIVSDGESTVQMATGAARAALTEAGLQPTDLDAIICATVTPDLQLPSSSCLIQAELGAGTCAAMDIVAACTGFVYALTTADQFVRYGGYENVLVVGSESLTRITDYEDRSSCILFGDGAGAAVFQRCDDESRGVRHHFLAADGSGWDFIHVPAGGTRTPASEQTIKDRQHFMKMRGRDVYKFAVQRMTQLIQDSMQKCDLSIDDVKLVIPHQVNQRIIDSAAEKAGFPMDKIYVNIDRFGNTSAASIPIAMHEARLKGLIEPGDVVIFVAFGAGLTWGSAVFQF